MNYDFITRKDVVQVTPDELFAAFKQDRVKFAGLWTRLGGGGNCASIALIKAAIGTFGLYGVFQEVTIDPHAEEVTVIRRDGKSVVLSFERLDFGMEHFFIEVDSHPNAEETSQYSAFCFAVMCRSKQLMRGDDTKYFYRAVDDLNKGEATSEIYKLLGVNKIDISPLTSTSLSNEKHLVLWNAPHAVYSSNGKYDEASSDSQTGIEPLHMLEKFHCKTNQCPILGAYRLC